MITRGDVDKLLSVGAAGPSLLSVYLRVPRDPAQLRELPVRADELLRKPVQAGRAERDTVRRLLAGHARDWLSHTIAIFACAELGLAEAIPLPGQLPERAVLAARPHVRPLLLAIQRCPAYHVVVVNRRHAWLLRVADDEIDAAALPDAEGVRSHGFGGWYGLDAYRINQRIIELTRHHYRDIAAVLKQTVRAADPEPLVIGGHEEGIPQVLAALPTGLRAQFAGSFLADLHTLTPAKVRNLADRIVTDWLARRDQRLIAEFLEEPAELTATGLDACIIAGGQHAIDTLLIPVDGLVPGYSCRRCGVLSRTGHGCAHGAAGAAPVPDLIEEIAVGALSGGAQVTALDEPPAHIGARLRFPLAQA
jgi:Bacterial archaeo-eukaryotic release factor family 10